MRIKSSIIFLFTLVSSLLAAAQTKSNKELGVMMEFGFPVLNANQSLGAGILYRVNKKNNRAIRFHALYKKQEDAWRLNTFQLIGDTLLEKSFIESNQTLLVGGGVEVQRRFYKKLFLYAALDTRLGYSTGTFHEKTFKRVNNPYFHIEKIEQKGVPNYKSQAIVLDFLASIGAKLDFQHIKIGLETGPCIHNSYATYKTGASYSIFDLKTELFLHRVYLTYQF